jgi:8-oxo-dGTP pyrophosphatase MutT (NUDIX family)
VLLREDGAALLQHRDDKPGLRNAGMWVPPGGHCELGESMEVCARREMREETGYDCDQLNWLISFEDDFAKEWPSYPLTVFWARYDGLQSVQCLEGQALQFVERHLATSYPIPAYLVVIWDLALAASKKKE